VACIIERGFDAVTEGHGFSIFDRREKRETSLSIFDSIKRDFRIGAFSALLSVPFAFILSVFFLYFG
jgi:hypothetical protein